MYTERGAGGLRPPVVILIVSLVILFVAWVGILSYHGIGNWEIDLAWSWELGNGTGK